MMFQAALWILVCCNSAVVVVHATMDGAATATTTSAGVRENGGNCAGVKSCRPRCISFRVERDVSTCGLLGGVFTVHEDVNPWDIKRFTTINCAPLGTCENDHCGVELTRDLTIRVGEAGHHGSFFYTTYDLPLGGRDRLTHCSMYPCTKEECALPEQMGLELQISFYAGAVRVDDFDAVPLLVQELYLKAAFVGAPLLLDRNNRFGLLHLEWMDDPTGCRVDYLPTYAPVAPPSDPDIWTANEEFQESLYCQGEEYIPGSLPAAAPSSEPSSVPTASPSTSISPSSAPSHTAIGIEQLEGLRTLYDATEMSAAISRGVHNWFDSEDYCEFTGVTCDERGYVILLGLADLNLAGTIPTNMDKLGRLRQLKLVNNRITGTIPAKLCNLMQLTQVELGFNTLTGTIPACLHRLRHLKRLLLQFNDLSGTIPQEFCQFNGLNAFDIAGNNGMFGVIPECMGSLPLDFLRVDNVGLVGTVPPLLCSRKSMNGLSPNPYGCNAIACPAGTYEATVGRSYKAGTQCINCEVPSNVIGSTNCRYVVNNTVISITHSPSVSPSSSPSLPTQTATPSSMIPFTALPSFTSLPSFIRPSISDVPSVSLQPVIKHTAEPSFLPSIYPSVVPVGLTTATPSGLPSSMTPSLLPSSTTITIPPSSSPSMKQTSDITLANVTVIFTNVQTILGIDDLQILAGETLGYLVSFNVSIERVSIVNQSIGDSTSSGARIETDSSKRRRLLSALFVDFEFEGGFLDRNFKAQVQSVLVDNFSNYSSFLFKSLPILTPLPFAPIPAPTPPPSRIKEQNEFIVKPPAGGSSVNNWWLLGSAIALSIVAIIAVLFVRKSRRASRSQTRLFPVEQTAVVGPASVPSVLNHRDGFSDDLSDESSSGWNSTSSPGDAGDNEFVNDDVVQEWTGGRSMDADSYLMSPERRQTSEDDLI